MVSVSPEVHDAILRRASAQEMSEMARRQGARTLREDGIAKAFERQFFCSADGTGSKREQLTEDIKTVATANLEGKGIAALQAAFAKGIKPLPEDNESTKTKPATPECCRLSSQS